MDRSTSWISRLALDPESRKIASADECDFWKIGKEIFRVKIPYELDTWGLPMGRRWECSEAHWIIFRHTVFSWARDCTSREEAVLPADPWLEANSGLF